MHRTGVDKFNLIRFLSIDDAWEYYLGLAPDTLTPETKEKLRAVFFDGFGMALHFWQETQGAADTFEILQKEYISQVKTACEKD